MNLNGIPIRITPYAMTTVHDRYNVVRELYRSGHCYWRLRETFKSVPGCYIGYYNVMTRVYFMHPEVFKKLHESMLTK